MEQVNHSHCNSYRDTLREQLAGLTGLLGSRIISGLFRVSASLVVARMVAPQAMGVVAWMGIVAFYAPILTLGVTQGAERLVPFLRGKGDLDTGRRLWAAALKMVVAASLLCLVAGAAFLAIRYPADPEAAWKIFWGAFLAALVLLALLGTTYLIAEKQFILLQKVFLTEAVLWWILVPLAALGVPGLRARLILATVLPIMIIWRAARLSIPLSSPRHKGDLPRLVSTGFPILVARMLMAAAVMLAQTMVGGVMGDVYLGYFWPSVLLLSFLRLAEQVTARALLPGAAELYGKTSTARAVARFLVGPVLCLVAGATLVAIAAWLMVGPVVRLLLPQYAPGIAATRILVLGLIAWAAVTPYVFFIAVGKQRRLFPIFLCGVAAQLGASLWLYQRGWGLSSFSLGYVIGLVTDALLINSGIVLAVRSEDRKSTTR